MKYKILRIKKRGNLACYFSLDRWEVTVKDEGGNLLKLNCWAGCPDHGTATAKKRLLWDLENKLRSIKLKPKIKEEGKDLYELQGESIEL